MSDSSLMVILVSNGPGELSTWVRPLAEKLHSRLKMRPRAVSSSLSMRLVLVPCPNSTGQESLVAKKWGQFEKIFKANDFWKLLINPSQFGHWSHSGVVVFLGGDQFWSVLLSARLGYRHITYAEWIARWPFWNDRIAAMSQAVKDRIQRRFRNKCVVVGDLMADLSSFAREDIPLPAAGEWVALLPGSKRAKLCVGVPFMLEVADCLSKLRPGCRFLMPIAPTTSVKEIQFFSTARNPISNFYESAIKEISSANSLIPWRKLITNAGTEIYLQENQPCHSTLSQCDFAITTIGANTAELGALALPMIVVVPTQHLEVMQAWDGLFGLLARIPFLSSFIGIFLSLWRLRKKGFLSWPNISADRAVVPERVGKISPQSIAQEASDWLSSPSRLKGQKEDLQSLRGRPGAVSAFSEHIHDLLISSFGDP